MTFLACHLTCGHIGRRIAFYADGRRVCGVLDGYYRHTRSYSLRVDGSWWRGIPSTSEIDLIEVPA